MQFHRETIAVALAGLLGMAACDAASFTELQDGEAAIGISVDVASLSIGGVSVEVTGPGIDQAIIATLPISGGVATGQVRVLAGSDRAFLIRAFDMQGMETHRGADTLDISADAAVTLAVALSPLTGDVDVDARVGDYTLTVSLPSTTLAVGGSAQATVTVVDALGDTLQSPLVTWGSSNPAVASVTAAGVVQGLVTGQASIGATYEGFGGTYGLSVQ